jgi:hypothetical protein
VTQPTHAELVQRLADAQASAEAAVAGLIFLELDEILTGLSASEDQAAAELRQRVEALTGPRAELAEMDKGIVKAEGRCVEWSERLSDPDPDIRASARNYYDEWSAQVATLRAERDRVERDQLPLVDAKEEARSRLRVLQSAKQAVMYAQLHPFTSTLAKATKAYVALRMPMLGPVLLRYDTDSPEWPEAVLQLEEWCLRSAYRTDHLPSNAAQAARAMTAAMPDGLADLMADPMPSMTDVMNQTRAEFEAMAVDKQVSRIDDYRHGPPRDVPERPYMQVPKLSDRAR